MKTRTFKLFILLVLTLVISLGYQDKVNAQQQYSVPTTPQNPFYVQFTSFNNTPVVTIAAATTLTAGQSGSTILLNSATGFTTTLPTPVAGMNYDFFIGTSQTSGTMKIITDAATTFITGPSTVTTGVGSALTFTCNGTSHIAIATNGTTSGGLIGTWIRFRALTTTLWGVNGWFSGSSTGGTPLATPCSVS